MKYLNYIQRSTILLVATLMVSFFSSVDATIVDARWLESKDGKQTVLLYGDYHAMIDQSDVADRKQLAIVKENLDGITEKNPEIPVTFLVEGRELGSLGYFPDTKLGDLYETCPVQKCIKNMERKNFKGWGVLLYDLQRLGEDLDQKVEQFNACLTEKARIDFMNIFAVCNAFLGFKLFVLRHIIAKDDPWLCRTIFKNYPVCSNLNHCKSFQRTLQQNILKIYPKKKFQKILHRVREAYNDSVENIKNMGFANISDDLLKDIEEGEEAFRDLLREVFECDLSTLMKKDQSDLLKLVEHSIFNFQYLKKSVIKTKIKKVNDLYTRFISSIPQDITPFLDTVLVEKTLEANLQEQKNLVIIFAGLAHTKQIAERYLKKSYVQKKYVKAEQSKKLSCHFFDWISSASDKLAEKNAEVSSEQQVVEHFPYSHELGIVGASIIRYKDKKILFLGTGEVVDAELNHFRHLRLLESKKKQLESYDGLSIVPPLSLNSFTKPSEFLDELNKIFGGCALFSDLLNFLNKKLKFENSLAYCAKLESVFYKNLAKKPSFDRYLDQHSDDFKGCLGLAVALISHKLKLINIIKHDKNTKLTCDCFYKISVKDENGSSLIIMKDDKQIAELYPKKDKNTNTLTCIHGSTDLWIPECTNNCNIFATSDLEKIFKKFLSSEQTIIEICESMKSQIKIIVRELNNFGFRAQANEIKKTFFQKLEAFENSLLITYGDNWSKMTSQQIIDLIEEDAKNFSKCSSIIKHDLEESFDNRGHEILDFFSSFFKPVLSCCILQDIFSYLQSDNNKLSIVIGDCAMYQDLFETERFSVKKAELTKSHVFYDDFSKSVEFDDSLDPEAIEKIIQGAFKEKSTKNYESNF